MCEHFISERVKKFGLTPTTREKIVFLESLFTTIITNATNYNIRTRLEAIAITLQGPDLNQQVKHKKVHIISGL